MQVRVQVQVRVRVRVMKKGMRVSRPVFSANCPHPQHPKSSYITVFLVSLGNTKNTDIFPLNVSLTNLANYVTLLGTRAESLWSASFACGYCLRKHLTQECSDYFEAVADNLGQETQKLPVECAFVLRGN